MDILSTVALPILPFWPCSYSKMAASDLAQRELIKEEHLRVWIRIKPRFRQALLSSTAGRRKAAFETYLEWKLRHLFRRFMRKACRRSHQQQMESVPKEEYIRVLVDRWLPHLPPLGQTVYRRQVFDQQVEDAIKETSAWLSDRSRCTFGTGTDSNRKYSTRRLELTGLCAPKSSADLDNRRW